MSRLMSPQSWRPRALWLAWVLVTVGLVAVAQWEGRRQQHSRLEAFGGDLQSLAQVSATILTQRLQQLDDVLLVLRAAYQVDPNSLEATIDLLRQGPLADRDLQVVRVDRAGLLAYADTPGAKPGMYLGDRSYFKFFADGAADQFLVDEPVLGRVTQRLSLPLVRPVYRPDGSFDGVLALSVTQASLTEFGARLQFSPDTVVGLFNLDGALVSRSRDLPALKGSRLAPMQMAPFLSEPYGVLDHVSPLDGVTRLAAFRRLAPLPLVVVVAADPGPLKRQTSLQTSALTFGACLMSAALGALLYYLSRALQRRREAALLLASSEARLRAVLAVMADGVVVLGPDGGAQSWNAAAERILGEPQCRELGLPGSGGTSVWIGEDGVALSVAAPGALRLGSGFVGGPRDRGSAPSRWGAAVVAYEQPPPGGRPQPGWSGGGGVVCRYHGAAPGGAGWAHGAGDIRERCATGGGYGRGCPHCHDESRRRCGDRF